MYKITLYDYNISGPCSGTACFFAEDLEEFERHWLSHEDVEEDRRERYLRSKSGEVVTDYYSDAPELNILQQDEEARCLWEEEIILQDTHVATYNCWWCEYLLYVKRAYILLKYIQFKGRYYLIGRYRLEGVCYREPCLKAVSYRRCPIQGNPVIRSEYHSPKSYYFDKEKERWVYLQPEEFASDVLESCCYVTLKETEEANLQPENVKEELEKYVALLLKDIPGDG